MTKRDEWLAQPMSRRRFRVIRAVVFNLACCAVPGQYVAYMAALNLVQFYYFWTGATLFFFAFAFSTWASKISGAWVPRISGSRRLHIDDGFERRRRDEWFNHQNSSFIDKSPFKD